MANNRDLFGGAARKLPPAAAPDRPVKTGTPSEADYTAASIEVLEGLEPVRRRPGMYIGGTDEAAMHHLFAEVLDNSMDEAVAGHATWIDVLFDAEGFVTVTDNGRGMPVEPHPKFPKKSTVEVIMTVLHAGGKFDSGAYQTSGGLHGVGVSVTNALSERLEVEVARAQTLYRQTFSRGLPTSELVTVGKALNRRGTKVRFKPDPTIFGPEATLKPARLFKMARAKAYLFGGVEIRWHNTALNNEGGTPREAVFHFPGGLKDYLAQDTAGKTPVTDQVFTGKVTKPGGHGSLEWAVCWLADDDGFVHSYCNTIPTPDGGTHEAGLRTALLRGLRDHAERIGQGKRAAVLTADDVMVSCAALISVFIKEPEFQGQNKGRLMTAEASPHRRPDRARRVRPLARLPALPSLAPARLDGRARRGAAAAAGREGRLAQDRDPQAAPPRQARRLHQYAGARLRDFHRRRRFRRRLRETGARPRQPGGPSA